MSNKKWNSKHCELAMKNLQEAVADEYPNLDLNYPYLDNICKQTQPYNRPKNTKSCKKVHF